MQTTTQYPKREQRKQASRAALVDAAIELFGRNGFAETKLEDIAERAGLHVQTLYRHFANKRDLVTAVDEHFLRRFQEACGNRNTDTLHFWRNWTHRSAQNIMNSGAKYRKIVHELYAVPEFPTPYLHIWHAYERTLAQSIAQDMGTDLRSDRLPVLIACMLWGASSHAFRDWLDSGGEEDLATQTLEMVNLVIDQYGAVVNGSADS